MRKRKKIEFNPSQKYLDKAVENYVKNSGKITRIQNINRDFDKFMSNQGNIFGADDFLMGDAAMP